MSKSTPTWENSYTMLAAGMRLAAYRVRDPLMEEGGWTELQFHLTYDNINYGVLSQTALECLKKFLDDYIFETEDFARIQENYSGNIRIVHFAEQQKDGFMWRVIHVYQNGHIQARMGIPTAKLFTTALKATEEV